MFNRQTGDASNVSTSSLSGNSKKSVVTHDEILRAKIRKFIGAHQHLSDNDYQHQLSKILASVECTETGNAIRFVARYGDMFRYVPESGKWFMWNGRIWEEDTSYTVVFHAGKVAAYIGMEADYIPPPTSKDGSPLMLPQVDVKTGPTAEQKKIIDAFTAHDKQVETLHKWAKSSRSKRALLDMIELAKAEPDMTLSKTRFDADDMLLNCQNGVLDLRTVKVLPHNRLLFMTRIANVNAVPGATCQEWDTAILKMMKNRPGLVRYLQQLAGMGLTGLQYEDVFPVFHGTGENGKTVFQEVLREIFGTYADIATSNMFMEQPNDAGYFEMAGIDGIRMIFKAETKQGKQLDEGLVKTMTGGDPVRACFKFKEHFTFKPKFTSILSTNHKPRIVGNDEGIWRRVKLVPWEYSFKNDPGKKSKPEVLASLRKEHEGILMWAIAGLQDLLTNGYHEPDEVKAATHQYRETSDVIGAFFDDKCIIGKDKDCWITKKGLYNVYRLYVEEELGGKPFNKPNFGELLRERGFEDNKTGERGWYWQGIRLRMEGEAYAETPKTDTLFTSECGLCGSVNWRLNALGKNECATCHDATPVQPESNGQEAPVEPTHVKGNVFPFGVTPWSRDCFFWKSNHPHIKRDWIWNASKVTQECRACLQRESE